LTAARDDATDAMTRGEPASWVSGDGATTPNYCRRGRAVSTYHVGVPFAHRIKDGEQRHRMHPDEKH